MKERLLSRREFLQVGGACGAALALGRPEGESYPPVISRIETELPYYALTIDDAWNPDILQRMKDFLKNNHLQATFFAPGSGVGWIESARPGIHRALVEDGHTFGYHSFSHPVNPEIQTLSYDWWRGDFGQWREAMQRALGDYYPLAVKGYARAPDGAFTESFLQLCGSENLTPFSWSASYRNLENGTPLLKGDVLLTHVVDSDIALMQQGLAQISGALTGTSISCLQDANDCVYYDPSQGTLRKRKNLHPITY